MGRIRQGVPRVDQDVGICDAKSDLRLAEVEVLHQMESTVLESTGYLFWGGGNRFVLTFHGQVSFAWNWAMLRCQCRIVDLAERALRYAEHRWGPHSGGLGNRDPETTGSFVVSYLYFMHVAYLLFKRRKMRSQWWSPSCVRVANE